MTDKNAHVGRSMAKGAAWMVLLRLAIRALSMVSTVVLARLLLPEDFGLVALAAGGAMAFEIARRRRKPPAAGWVLAFLILVVLGLETAVEPLVNPVKEMDELTAAIAERFPGQGPVPGYLPQVVSNYRQS